MSFTHFLYDDPIVYPGRPGASHLHIFYGNSRVNANTTAANIRSNCQSAAAGGTANCSAYWMPAFIDGRGRPVVPNPGGVRQYHDDMILYYKTGYTLRDDEVRRQVVPPGLRMIAGNANATGPQGGGVDINYSCDEGPGSRSIPNCRPGQEMIASISFPNCWNGRDLDSPDHQSHMAYASGGSGCPSSHPVPIPEIRLNAHYWITDPDGTRSWRLSSDNYSTSQPGGYSLHADWFNGWDPAVANIWLTNCNHALRDCGVDDMGNGQRLIPIGD
jgi:hypothetical protein